MKLTIFIAAILSSLTLTAQKKIPFDTLKVESLYDSAYLQLKGMLEGKVKYNFKQAVFLTENAYLENSVSYKNFNSQIQRLVRLCQKVIDKGGLIYDEKDKVEVSKYASVFVVMKQLQLVEVDSASGVAKPLTPFKYDFDDFWGEWDWSKMFVTKLLSSNTGNCHSLPFLYKILCEELNAKAYLAMAPNHIYIKHWCRKLGWFNTELTSGYFPIDAWIMASGYVHLSAIQNGVYMDTLSAKQSIAVCTIDLAKGYEKKFGKASDLSFIMKCSDLALNYYPNYANGLILKAETIKKKFENQMADHKAEYPSDIFNVPEAKSIYDEMEKLYFHIHNLGYRMMPKEMYLGWLDELKNEREKYSNKNVIKELNSK